MPITFAAAFALVFLSLQPPAAPKTGDAVPLDLTAVRPGPVTVVRGDNAVTVSWPDETKRVWRATFSLDPAQPLITSIGPDGEPVVRGARPFYRGETGKRRGGWYAFFDDPTSHPDGTRHVQSTFTLRSAVARTVGERVEIVFDGLRMGSFDGGLAYTFYPGSRLIQQEAVMTTTDPDVAYYYDAGLDMAAASDRQPGNNMRTEVVHYDTEGVLRRTISNGLQAERVPVQARYRTLAVKTGGGSVAVFPSPHQYFFPRDFTSNLGFVWHRAWRGRVSLGIRQLRDENWQYYPWVNAPPGRPQRMGVFFLLATGAPESTLAHVLRYTNADRFRPLDGYKTLSTHWHLAYTVQAMANGFQWTPPFKPVLKAMGVDASVIMDFHGDGHPADLTDVRLEELHAYFGALKAQSDADFLLIPAEEANVHLGGHWALVFPKPVYWFMNRPTGGAFASTHPKYGTVYSVADAKEMLDLVRREGGYMYQTHPRTKGSTGFPDKIVGADYFRDASYLGVGWKAMPSDLSSPRLGDRVFDLADELNNQGLRKRMLGEVDVFQVDHTHELYAHMNVNYVKLDRLPTFDRWGDALAPLARGEFFTTTGEVLLPEVNLASSSATEIVAKARVQWTFPLRFAEIVWGDGQQTHREAIELADTREFGSQTFEWRAAANGWKWARVAVWDVAGNGAFVNPVWRPAPAASAAAPEVVSVARIWDVGAHNAFTDLIRWRDRWYCTFREGDAHVGGDGRIRVLSSVDGETWTSSALIGETGIDLRDPKFSITPDDRLMIVAGGSVYEGTRYMGRQPRVMFSSDGGTWTAPQRILAEGDWLWRVTWHEGRAYGVTYRTKSGASDEWTATLVSSRDGRTFEEVTTFAVPGRPNETTLRVMPDGEMVALVRREAGNRVAWVGRSRAPYTTWTWRETPEQIGGPNFIRLPDGELWASGRRYLGGPKTVIGRLTPDGGYEPAITLPSGGDTSYAGMVWHDGLLWVSYYASHEGKTAIYLARVKLR